MRLIDADALIKKIFPYDGIDKKAYTINAKMIYEEINKAHTIDIKTEVAREIFAEIYKTTASVYNEYVRTTGSIRRMDYAFVINLEHAIDELKNKYTKEGAEE